MGKVVCGNRNYNAGKKVWLKNNLQKTKNSTMGTPDVSCRLIKTEYAEWETILNLKMR